VKDVRWDDTTRFSFERIQQLLKEQEITLQEQNQAIFELMYQWFLSQKISNSESTTTTSNSDPLSEEEAFSAFCYPLLVRNSDTRTYNVCMQLFRERIHQTQSTYENVSNSNSNPPLQDFSQPTDFGSSFHQSQTNS
jgi:hypothetical protein